MCGIIAVVRRPPGRTPPAAADVLALLEAAPAALVDRAAGLDAALRAAAEPLEAADGLLRGVPGVTALLHDRSLLVAADRLLAALADDIAAIERRLDDAADGEELDEHDTAALERTNAALIRL